MKDFKKINTAQICSIRSYIKLSCDHYTYTKARTFLFFWKRSEGFYFYTFSKGPVFITKEQIEKENNNLYCEGNTVYYKPHIEFRMSNQSLHTKFFESEEELIKFVDYQLCYVSWIENE